MDHDRLFKELLSTFFTEFIELFLPDVDSYLDKDSPVSFMDKELFTDIALGDKHEADLVARAKFRGEDAYFLVHIENQATKHPVFAKRMFRYFARLTEKHNLPVYPIVVFSYDQPRRAEPKTFEVTFPGYTVLTFEYRVIQLNRLPWRRFVDQHNPVASALMSRMQMAAQDRPKVKLECLRLLASLKLDPAKTNLIGVFIESYLKLTADEMRVFESEIETNDPEERKRTMALMTYWEEKGLEAGVQQGMQQGMQIGVQMGKERLVKRMITRRLGSLSPAHALKLDTLSSEQLDALGEALFDFATSEDLDAWLVSAH